MIKHLVNSKVKVIKQLKSIMKDEMAIKGIDYDELEQSTYRGIIISLYGSNKEIKFESGDFIKDYIDSPFSPIESRHH